MAWLAQDGQHIFRGEIWRGAIRLLEVCKH